MVGIFALTASLLLAGSTLVREPRDNLRFLPDDLCVDFSIFHKVVEPECSEYFIVNPKTGTYDPYPLPLVIDYEFALMTNEALQRGLILLKKKSFAD